MLAKVIVSLLLCALLGCANTSDEPEDYSALSKQTTYRVKSGDTMYSIAFRYGMDFRRLAEANGIRPPYTIYPGELLLLDETHQPGVASAPPAPVVLPVPAVAQSYPVAAAPAPIPTSPPVAASQSAAAAVSKPYPIVRNSTPSSGTATSASTPVVTTPSTLSAPQPMVETRTPVTPAVPVSSPATISVPPIEEEMASVAASTVATAVPAEIPPPSPSPTTATQAKPAAQTKPTGTQTEPTATPAVETETAPPAPAAAPQPTEPAPQAAAAPVVASAALPAKPEPSASSADTVVVWRWPTSGSITRGYSESVHKGIDIGGARGDPVVAVAAGKVVYAGTGIVGFGELLIVKHNDVYLSAYGHNDELLVKEGDSVTAGQVIAQKGSSGTDTVKLHFEVRKEGKPIDPQRVLPKR